MISKVCLLLLVALGIALLGLPQIQAQVSDSQELAILALWTKTTKMFAIPLALLLLGLMKSLFIRFCYIAWGLWMAGLSIATLWQSDEIAPFVTTYGYLFISAVGTLGLALMLFSIVELTRPKKPS